MSGIDESVETQADFAQSLMEDGVMDWLLDSNPGEEEAPADTEAPVVERPRDPETGRFTKAETPEEAAENEGLPPAEEPEEETLEDEEQEIPADDDDDLVIEIDDDLQAVLDKYDGDVGKALRALGESQSMIGRQGNELGDLRRQVEEQNRILQELAQRPQPQPQYMGPYMNDIDENPQGLAVEALERGDGRTLELALRAWGEEDPFGATTFLISLQQQAAAQQAAQPVEQPTPATQATGQTLEEAMSAVVARHPDVEKYLPAVQQVAEEFPTLRDSMKQGSPQLQAQAFEELLKIAKARDSETPKAAMKKVILKAQEEVQQELAEAQVVSAKQQTAATRETRLDEFYRAFDEAAERYGTGGDWITRSND